MGANSFVRKCTAFDRFRKTFPYPTILALLLHDARQVMGAIFMGNDRNDSRLWFTQFAISLGAQRHHHAQLRHTDQWLETRKQIRTQAFAKARR